MNRRLAATLALACTLLAGSAAAFDQPYFARGRTLPAAGTVQVVFTPGDDVTGLLVQIIHNARKQILVQAFSFTSREIANALVFAQQRGVDVQVIADDEQVRRMEHSQVPAVAAWGVPTYVDREHASAHNKVMVIDANTLNPVLITGSFNFTHAAQHQNAENLLVFRGNRELTAAYFENWQRHRQHATAYRPDRRSLGSR
jgi:phosphatidylserine/phosphatidylglycerophosphate/cardiolipin synthase-like enzyme